MEILMTE